MNILAAIIVAVAWWGTPTAPLAVVNAVLSFWSNGVIANYEEHERDAIPNWAKTVSSVTSWATVILAVAWFLTKP